MAWIGLTLLILAVITLLRTENIMSVADDLNAKVDALAGALVNIRQDIADIKANLPASGGLTAEEVAALGARLDTVIADALELDGENPAPVA